jgi:branched-chain amino acid transport system permease protein
MKKLSNRRDLIKVFFLIGFICLLVILPAFSSPYVLHVMILIYTNCIIAIGLWLLVQVRIFNLGHAGFVAIGAYTCALLKMKMGLPSGFALLTGGLVTALVAIVIGIPILRVRGLYFLILSFAFGEVIRLGIVNWPSLLGGVNGLRVSAISPLTIPGLLTLDFSSKSSFYYLSLIIGALTFLIVYRIFRCKIGLILKCVGEDEDFARTVGIDPLGYKILVLGISCFLGGIGGGLFAFYYNFLSPMFFTVWQSIYYFVYVMLGGPYSIAGPLVGVPVFIIVGELVRPAQQWQPIIYACMVLFGTYFFPRGFVDVPRLILVGLRGLRISLGFK